MVRALFELYLVVRIGFSCSLWLCSAQALVCRRVTWAWGTQCASCLTAYLATGRCGCECSPGICSQGTIRPGGTEHNHASRAQVVMLGLDAAGKTTILYKLHIGEILSTVPTIGAASLLPCHAFGLLLQDQSRCNAGKVWPL